jgi:hypothetical protein
MIADEDQYQGTPELSFADQESVETSATKSKYLIEYNIDPTELA